MIARLWWKEARQVWPIWALLAATGLAIQGFVGWFWGVDAGPGGYVQIALVISLMYLFLIAAAVFAGERENGTLWMLDAIPIERWKVWAAKASFALVTTAALSFLLWLGAAAFGVRSSEWERGGVAIGVWGLLGLGWGLLCSSLLANALFSAILAMIFWSLSLLFLVDLSQGQPSLQAVPALLAVGLLAAAASAVCFQLGGPPRWAPRRVRPRPDPLAPETEAATAALSTNEAALRRVWSFSVPRLAWEALREVRSNLWMLLVLALASIVVPIAIAWNNTHTQDLVPFSMFGAAALAILTGVSVFNGENRGGTNRFLLRHAARPGLVWLVKVLIWWGVACVLWGFASSAAFVHAALRMIPSNSPYGALTVIYWLMSALSIAFAVSVLCGMVFKRGIMAGTIAVVGCIILLIFLVFLFTAQVLAPSNLPYIAIALLAVSWAWSGDWLLDRPGLAGWARLALYSAAVPAVLVPAYIAERNWLVPTLPAAEAEALFETGRIAAPIPDSENAASLYREADHGLRMDGLTAKAVGDPARWADLHFQTAGDWDPTTPGLTEWLARIEPLLEILRKAARMPACRFDDLRTATLIQTTTEPATLGALTPLIVSARNRLARGDLQGSWTEIETLLRMASQWSYTPSITQQSIEPVGIALAMQWAADPSQTAESLEAGCRAWRAIPEPASKADRLRIETLVFRNTLNMDPDELAEGLFFRWAGGRKKIRPEQRLQYDIQTTRWEIARTRKVFDLIAAARIQDVFAHPYEEAWPHSQPWLSVLTPLVIQGGSQALSLSREELSILSDTTPLLRHYDMGWRFAALDRSEVARRAVGLIFRLRIWQARHDGALPHSLNELPDEKDEDGQPDQRDQNDRMDLYTSNSKPFGYIPSDGQLLLPLGTYDQMVYGLSERRRLRPTPDSWLLYSVGPDKVDDRAVENLNNAGKGDIIFPIKDGVKPPEPAAP